MSQMRRYTVNPNTHAPFRWPDCRAWGTLLVVVLCAPLGCGYFSSDPPKTGKPAGQGAPSTAAIPREKIFEDWPTPKLALVFTGEQVGYIEPCGCAGLENQKGGLARRHTLLEDLQGRDWPVIPLELGGQIRRYGPQAEIKFQIAVEALRTMQYQAVGLGPGDLRLPTGELVSAVVNLADQQQQSRFVAANVGIYDLDSGLMPKYRILETPAGKIGVTAILGEEFRAEVSNEEIVTAPAAEALKEIAPLLREQCQWCILLSHATREESRTLASEFPQFDFVVTAQGAPEPPAEAVRVARADNPRGDTLLLEVGHKGSHAAVIGLYDDAPAWRYQRVPLDSRFKDSEAMLQLMVAYQDQLRGEGFEGLQLRPLVHPIADDAEDPRGRFVGAKKCGECHKKAYEKWAASPHHHATDTLLNVKPTPRHFDPECLSCHVTGWDAQAYLPYVGGYEGLDETPHLMGNGCENCHGPGASHAEAEEARGARRNLALLEQFRSEMRRTRATIEEQTCTKCHDLDNSPQFDFSTYWPKIAHPWKD